MDDPVYVASTTVSSTNSVPSVGFDIFAILGQMLGGGDGVSGLFSFGGILGFLGVLWLIIVVFGYILAIAFLVLYVYASTRLKHYEDLNEQELRNQERLYDQHFRGVADHSQLGDILQHTESDNPNDWKLAIIEADVILDETLRKRGFAGSSLGERLKSVSPNQLASLQDAWEAHKIRNRIAHEGSDFVLTQRLAQETIARYRRVFEEFGIR